MSRFSPAELDGPEMGSGFGDGLFSMLTGLGLDGLDALGAPSASSRMSSMFGGGEDDGGISEGERGIMTIAFSTLIGSFCVQESVLHNVIL